jgi:hypothetical protein
MVKLMAEKSPKALMLFTPVAQVLQLRDGEGGVVGPDPIRALADVDQAVLVAVGERPQQHAAHEAEHRGIGADAERQRHDDGEGQPFGRGRANEGRIGGR